MTKTAIYLMPGLGASPAIFNQIKLSSEKYNVYYLSWKKPISIKETISNYAKRMSTEILEKNIVLVGVSFGGIIVQEMSRFLSVKKIIIISSIKSHKELPPNLKFLKNSKLYTLFPSSLFRNIEKHSKVVRSKSIQKKIAIYKKYFTMRDKLYLNWAIKNVLHWHQNFPLKNIIHIHGTADSIFPIRYIKNPIRIDSGTHSMILTRGKEITQLIDNI